jgi:hypothetical protein
MNEHRTTENDELFAQVPDEDKYGMIAFIKKKKFFPNRTFDKYKDSTLLTVKDKYLYCFLLTIYPFESHSYMQSEILRQIRAFRQEK